MVQVYITIDTEYEFGFTAKHGHGSRAANYDRAIRGRTADGEAGIFHQMDVMDAHGLKAVFFVDPMPSLLWGKRATAEVVEPILKRGHDVQLHLHTEWLALLGDRNPLGKRTGSGMTAFGRDDQRVLIERGIELLMAAGAPRPVAFRAGNYAANDDTLRALADAGIAYDSSHTPGLACSDCEIGLGPEHRRPLERLGVIEVPIGCIGDAFGGLRHAQITALSYRETVAALGHARDNDIGDFTLVSHSFELLCRRRQQVNRIVQRRFAKVCERIASMKGISTATYADDPPQLARRTVDAPVLPPAPLLNGERMIEQAVANALYGRKTPAHLADGDQPVSGVAAAARYLEIANRARVR